VNERESMRIWIMIRVSNYGINTGLQYNEYNAEKEKYKERERQRHVKDRNNRYGYIR